MSEKQTLFDSDISDDEVEEMDINFGNKYAKQYNDWRRKEEMQRLKDKYGDNLDIMSEIEDNSGDENEEDEENSESESSNIESEDEEFDEQFATVLSALKKKDPKIYDKDFSVQKKQDKVNQDEEDDESDNGVDTAGKKMTLPEYHRKLIKEKKGITEEDEGLMGDHYDEDNKPPGYYQELQNIRQEINNIVQEDSEDDEDNMFSVKQQQNMPSTSKQSKETVDLSTIWQQKSKIDKNDAFLRDYIVNKRYAESAEDLSKVKTFQEPSSHFGGFENYSEDELGDEEDEEEKMALDNQDVSISKKATEGISVKKFHFEEPDANVIKRFPRNVQSVRDMTEKESKTKRAEAREKKKLEKESELKKMRRLKREEMESRIAKLKDISGNSKLDIKDLDLNVIVDDDNDFDLEKYDQKMNTLFGNDYYNVEEDSEKPEFAYCEGIDDDLYPDEEEMPKCIQKNNKKWKKKKDSKKLDIMKDDDIGIYEDLIGGEIATRFRYRMVETNDFGLTDEEILFADEKELNRWCSLKKMSQYRSKGEEENDKKSFDRKKDNMQLKERILKSLYGEEAEENPIIKAFSKRNETDPLPQKDDDVNVDEEGDNDAASGQKEAVPTAGQGKKKNRKRGKKKKEAQEENNNEAVEDEQVEKVQDEEAEQNKDENPIEQVQAPKSKSVPKSKPAPVELPSNSSRKRKRPQNNNNNNNNHNQNKNSKNKSVGNSGLSEARLKAYGMSNRDIKRVKL